jgi:Zn-dependent protease with chaperone function
MATARSSYAEVRSRSGIVAASLSLFALGTAGTAALFGTIGPMIAYQERALQSTAEHLIWGGSFAVTLIAIAGGTYFAVRKGTNIAKAMRGTKVSNEDELEIEGMGARMRRRIEQYAHFVETCSMSAGLGYVPEAYVLFDEPGINAFAAGSGPGNAIVGITAGALEAFDDAELEGVVGHEIAHIAQGDTRTSVITTAVCIALLFMAEIGRLLLNLTTVSRHTSRRSSSKDNKSQSMMLAIGVGLTVAGLVGVLFGRILQALISRQSEYRADAAGALYAGTPSGLISALRKIESHNRPDVGTNTPSWFAHLMLAPPSSLMKKTERAMNLAFGTHPPTSKRIQTLGGISSERDV